MKGAAVAEKASVVEGIEQFAHSADPGLPSLEQWWASAKQRLASFGCSGCAAQASNPKTPSSQQASVPGCKPDAEKLVLVFTAELTDDGFASDAADLNSEPDLAPEDMAAAALENKPAINARPVPPPPRVAPAEAATVATRPETREADVKPSSMSATVYPLTPQRPGAFVRTPDGRFLLYRLHFDHPAPNDDVYAQLFRDIGELGNDALYEEVEIRGSGTQVVGHDPPGGGLDDAQIKILQQAALACNQELAAWHEKEAKLYSAYAGFPPGWALYAPPLPETQWLKDQRTRVLNRYIKNLRLQLGAASSAKLEGFARKLYHAVPGRIVITPPPDDSLYVFFLRYINMLGQVPAAQRELAKRQQELAALGFGKDGWATLKEVALSFDRARSDQEARILELQTNLQLLTYRQAPGSLAVSSGAPTPGPAWPPVKAAGVPLGMPSVAAVGQVSQPNGVTASTDVRAAELTKLINEGKLITSDHIKRLQADLGKADFQKLDKYVHQLYAHAGRATYIATSPQASSGNSAQQPAIRATN
jgi:hypothetical protein